MSANKFGRTSPTEARHVRAECPDAEVFVVDSGPAEHGLESTVLRVLTGENGSVTVEILRPGAVTVADIEGALASEGRQGVVRRADSNTSPGHREHHYMPKVPLAIVPAEWFLISGDVREQISAALKIPINKLAFLTLSDDPQIAARELYDRLHILSATGADAIVFGASEDRTSGLWEAIWDRLSRAAAVRF